ncbi:MAG: hypothetical protein WA082_01925 [Candidatus Moraniibacteriota bacterium]
MSVQKKVIFGDVMLLPVDAAVVVEVIVGDHVVIHPGETHWSVPFGVTLLVPCGQVWLSRAATGFRVSTEQARGEQSAFRDTGEVLTCDDCFFYYSRKINHSPRVEAVRRAIRAVAPWLQGSIIDNYQKGEVSFEQIADCFNQCYEALPTPKRPRKKAS